MEKRKATIRFQKRRTLRLTAEEDEKLTRQAATAGISVARTGKRSILDSDGLEGFQASFYGLTHPPDFENRMLKIL